MAKNVHVRPESVFTFRQNRCSRSPRKGVHVAPEYALRLRQIIGDPEAEPPIPSVIPVSKSSWWAGVKSGKYPPAVKLGPRTTAWRAEAIRDLIEKSGDARRAA